MDFIEIFKLISGGALIAGVVGAFVNQLIQELRDRWKEGRATKQQGAYLSARLAVDLETYTLLCAEWITENDRFARSGGEMGKRHIEVPYLHEYPKDLDWKVLPAPLLTRILSFPIEVELANRDIKFWLDIDTDRLEDECDEWCALLGVRAWQIAVELRGLHSIPRPELRRWDFVKFLMDRVVAAERRIEASKAELAKKRAEVPIRRRRVVPPA